MIRRRSSSGSLDARPNKRARQNPSPSGSEAESDSGSLKVYVVQAKLDPEEVTELYNLIEGHLGSESQVGLETCSDAKKADIIITAVRTRRRLERHLDWNLAKQKAIVTPDWLKQSTQADRILPCGRFVALEELQDETIEHCPDAEDGKDNPSSFPSVADNTARDSSMSCPPTNPRVFENWRARYACQRASPLVCPNQSLAEALSVLARGRELEGLSMNALAYQRAISVIKSYPDKITRRNIEDVAQLPGLGSKILSKVREHIETGSIQEVEVTLLDDRYQALSAFSTIYGVGVAKAQEFFDMGMRRIADIERYCDVGIELSSLEGRPLHEVTREVEHLLQGLERRNRAVSTPNGKNISGSKARQESNSAPDLTLPVALILRPELEATIPRREVEEICNTIMRELDELQPDCICTIVGGYRRGRQDSNDVDIVFTHPDAKNGARLVKGLCAKLTAKLHQRGLVTHVMHSTGFHAHNVLRNEHWDSLEKSLTVFRLPITENTGPRLHRHVDLIFATPDAYWTAVIGWSGSKMFQRDLRLYAKQERGMKFDSNGITRRHDTKVYAPRSEQEVFGILGLDWIDPTMRNADA